MPTFTFLRNADYLSRPVLARLAIFLAVALSLVWTGVALEHRQLELLARVESERSVRNLARAFAEEIDSTIGTVDLALIALRGRWNGDRAGFLQLAGEIDREFKNKVMFQVALTDRHGVIQYLSSGPVTRRIDIGDREHVRALLQDPTDRLTISQPIVGRSSGVLGIHFARPVYGPGGELAGTIIAGVSPEFFSRFYRNIDLGERASIAVVRRGVVLARSTGAGHSHVGVKLTGHPYENTRETAGSFRRVSRLDGVDRFYGWRKLPHYDMLVTVGQSVDSAHARYAGQHTYATGIGTLLSLALLVLGWGYFATSHQRRRARRELAATEARWKLALDAADAGVWDWNVPAGTVVLTPRAQQLLGIDRPHLRWTFGSLEGRIHPDDLDKVAAGLRALIEGRSSDHVAEFRALRPDGSQAWLSERARVVERSDSGAALRVVGTVTNIDERKSRELQMRHLATHDPLTGLANRALFHDRLQQAVLMAQREKTSLGLIYFDLDKFKPVNDNFGHAAGDQLLVQVAERVRDGLRQSDTLARLGGDEFAVLLPNCSSATDAVRVATNILAMLNQQFCVEDHVVQISGSLGVTVFPDCSPDPQRLVRDADQAMYQSKHEGRGRVTLFGATVAAS